MKKLWGEFKEFMSRGNAMDLAVAVVIGAAFTAIINSLVGDLVTPLISLLTFNVDFSSLQFTVGEGDNPAVFAYGKLIQAIINFLVIAVVIFFVIKGANSLARKQVLNKTLPTMACPYCCSKIPDTAVRCPNCTSILESSEVPEDVR